MISRGKTNPLYGEFTETDFLLVHDLNWHLNTSYIIYKNVDQQPVIRFSMVNNRIQYEYYDFADSQWKLGGILTPTDPSSSRVPSIGGSYIQFQPDSITQYINDQIQLVLDSNNLDLQGKTITGLLPSSDLNSAVTLQQLQGIIAGDTSDTIISADMHSRVKTFSSYIQLRVNNYEAIQINKLNASQLELDMYSAIATTIKTSSASNSLVLQNAAGSLQLQFASDILQINKKVQYSFDSLLDILGNDDLVDLKSVKRDFVQKTAESDLNMNNYQINNLQNASLSSDAVTLGQLTTHQFLYVYSSTDLIPLSGTEYIVFQQAINPQVLSPPVVQRAQLVNPTSVSLMSGIYRITLYIIIQYKSSTQYPVTVCFEGFGATGIATQSQLQGNTPDNYTRLIHNQRTFILKLNATETFKVRVNCLPAYTSKIAQGCSLDIQLIN